jgi:predicted nuclease with TOPRIM domain
MEKATQDLLIKRLAETRVKMFETQDKLTQRKSECAQLEENLYKLAIDQQVIVEALSGVKAKEPKQKSNLVLPDNGIVTK